MFGLRQAFRSSLRIFSVKTLEKSSIPETQCRPILQALQNEGLLVKFSTQPSENPEKLENNEEKLTQHPVAKLEVTRMKIMFTCKKCDTRNSKTMSKQAYEKGVVLIRCDGCKNNHLIADNLGWFGADQHKRNIEWIMKHKGETVKRLTVYGSDTLEYVAKDEQIEIEKETVEQVEVKIPEGER